MTLDEAKLVAKIVGTADGGCGTCVNKLVEHLNREFSGFVFEVADYARDELDDEDYMDPWYGSRIEVNVTSKAALNEFTHDADKLPSPPQRTGETK